MFKKVGCKTPRFRKPTPPPVPNPNYTPPPSVVKTSPPNVGSSIQHPKQPCTYETPCGWCTKWDKKCDRKTDKAKKYTDERLNYDLHYECLKKTLERDIKEIKVTSEFQKYLEKRYILSLTSNRPAHCFYPEYKFMGIPVVVDDSIESSYAIVFKKENE